MNLEELFKVKKGEYILVGSKNKIYTKTTHRLDKCTTVIHTREKIKGFIDTLKINDFIITNGRVIIRIDTRAKQILVNKLIDKEAK
ncbi:hypothetical protein LCGC14_0548330 [marine sediment metagenome]|uniref:Uncharacterized protein n=1 Tax=marine sediment metagenome TaxID=412755 RepID=A0A0F9S9A9_9ZZZZ